MKLNADRQKVWDSLSLPLSEDFRDECWASVEYGTDRGNTARCEFAIKAANRVLQLEQEIEMLSEALSFEQDKYRGQS